MHTQDKTPAALTASTPTLASASASSSNITLSQARLTHVQCNDATSAKEDSASPRADCQMHSLAQPARTSAASMHSLREPVCGQHRSVLSGAQPPTQVSNHSLSRIHQMVSSHAVVLLRYSA